MPVTLQPQRVPLGVLEIGGKSYPVTITLEWYRALQRLAGQASTGSGEAGSGTGGSAGGGGSTGGFASAQDGIDFDYGAEQAVKVFAIALERGLQALEADTELPRLRAQLAALAARVEGLEQST